jgi:hypothetical protein
MRPPRAAAEELTYSEIIERAGHDVRNVSKAGVTLQEAFGLLDDEAVTVFPEVVIIHHGVVEVCYRRTVRRWNNAGIPNVYLNRAFKRRYEFKDGAFRLENFFWRAVNWATRIFATALGVKWQWQKPERFVEVLTRTCELILKETAAVVLVVGITPCSTRVERILPGSASEILRTNELMQAACAKMGERTRFVDLRSMCPEEALPQLAPDGIHFSAAGHRLLAERLLSEIAALPLKS